MSELISELDLARKIQCFTCRQLFFLCHCPDHQAVGRDAQFIIEEEDLPVDPSIEANIQFWGKLLRVGKATQKFDVDQILNQLFSQENVYSALRDESNRERFYSFWQAYTQHEHFNTVIVKAFPGLSVEDLQLVGKEGLDSLFSGRWYELCDAEVGLIMNALQSCGPNPRDLSSAELRKIANCLMLIGTVLESISTKRGFSIVDPYRLASMRSLCVYKLKPKSEVPAETQTERRTGEELEEEEEDEDLPALIEEPEKA